MNRCYRDRCAVCLLAVTLLPAQAAADGGTIRLSEQVGSYRITLFTAPTPLRAGPVDFSVFVQQAATGAPAPDVQVTITVAGHGAAYSVQQQASHEAATNKLFHAATFDLPEPGWYSVAVSIDNAVATVQVRCAVEAAASLPSWLGVLPWVGWPFLVILLFGAHVLLVRRRSRSVTGAVRASARVAGSPIANPGTSA